jgi:hypothetical protein
MAKVKSPTELVVGTVRLTGSYGTTLTYSSRLQAATAIMGQQLLDPPSVEGWHTGGEWITTGSLVSRINFASEQFANADKPGVRDIILRIKAEGDTVSPQRLVDTSLDLMGSLNISQATKQELLSHAMSQGDLRFGTDDEDKVSAQRVREMLQLIVSTREYQLA